MLSPVRPTDFDLDFTVFNIPVRVSPWFWIASAVLGWGALDRGVLMLMLWIFVVFVSILVHELGHAITAKWFGYDPRVLLYHFGGLAMYQPYSRYTTGRALLITAAGPAAGLLLFGLVAVIALGLYLAKVRLSEDMELFLWMWIQVNLFWSLLNLLPVLPLDGGRICQEILVHFWPASGIAVSLKVSAAVGLLIAGIGIALGAVYVGILFGMLAFGSVMELQARQGR